MNSVDDTVAERLQREADHCYRWSDGPGAEYAVHSHPFKKILYVAEGSITFTSTGKPPVTMRTGDRLELAAGTPHSAVVGGDGVVCWEGRARSG